MHGAAGRIFRIIIVEGIALRQNFGDSERDITHDAASQFATINIALDHHQVAITPFGRGKYLRRMRLILLDYDDTEGRSFPHRLHHIRRTKRTPASEIKPAHPHRSVARATGSPPSTLPLP